MTSTNAHVLRLCATRIVPAGLVLGASMEAFMWATGFWSTATRKASEREVETRDALNAARRAARERYATIVEAEAER